MTGTIVVGIVCLGLCAMLAYVTQRLSRLIEDMDERHRQERHTLANRIQAPSVLPVAPTSGDRTSRPVPPPDVKEYARVGTVTHAPENVNEARVKDG